MKDSFDQWIGAALTDPKTAGADEAHRYAAAIEDHIRMRARRRGHIILAAVLLGAASAALGVYGLVQVIERTLSATAENPVEVVGMAGGGVILMIAIVTAIVAECLPQSR
jgi:hypothetical protein